MNELQEIKLDYRNEMKYSLFLGTKYAKEKCGSLNAGLRCGVSAHYCWSYKSPQMK